ncbi:MAG: shikimate kinase [Candidatus Omnitrophica bacterium CG11_big_fil_rev_8_21_14_0_20_45_26]|uniref:Shikimate kinase n=1 Tax=Candidatus Abzuiibacterium crystallinum TaxID=1974748 RepID=A0A2H0LMH0_9BACT|nr:MAG: shikimate kinase [Candidatus Omnitrophica bacterium CG11_big_fil_rev_8_21_14_0_20_45_26]PIW65163.1 MAG: shikimate kinase [Candidatus Omnitrophica bacterium CG12_big_fil_rev_8_21_14_0_65_45_16]
MKHIFLIGMMGSGKSSTAVALAQRLQMPCEDLDTSIEHIGEQTVKQIFEDKGELHFRQLEKLALREAVKKSSRVIATGGGIILDQSNINLMKSAGTIVFLRTSLQMLLSRLQNTADRPLLGSDHPQVALEKIWHERASLYETAADLIADTDGKTADEVAGDIEGLLT